MKITRRDALAGIAGSVVSLSAAPRQRGTDVTRRQLLNSEPEYPYFVPDELLLTFNGTDRKFPLQSTDSGVKNLYDQAKSYIEKTVAPSFDHLTVPPAPPPGLASPLLSVPLTLRIPVKGAMKGTSNGVQPEIIRAVNRVNLAILQGIIRPVGGVTLMAATPNWIVSSAQSVVGHFGPGSLPSAAPAQTPTRDYRFALPSSGTCPPPGQGAPPPPSNPRVVVFIADTWPLNATIQNFAKAHPQNKLLGTIAKTAATRAISVPGTPGRPIPPPPSILGCPPHTLTDHGLFVAGVVSSVATQADIRPLRLLNEFGLGHVEQLMRALDSECWKLATQPGQRPPIVVNLSLYLTIPPDGILRSGDLDQGSALPLANTLRRICLKADPTLALGRESKYAPLLLMKMDEPLRNSLARLKQAGAMVVAAAGNDALSFAYRGNHPQPRTPADYDDSVFCVVATHTGGKIASYSNRADAESLTSTSALPPNNCFATLGGQAKGTRIPKVDDPDPDAVVPGGDGVVGLYVQPTLPSVGCGSPKPNTSGWVYWSGTSFAAPMISGLVANLLTINALNPSAPPLTWMQMRTQLQSMSCESDSLRGYYIPITQHV